MAATQFSLEQYGIRQAGVVEIQDALASHVKQRFNDAVLHKRSIGIEAQLLRNLRANKCQYQPDEIGLLGPFNNVYIGLCALKARAAESWLTDIILNNIEKPWTLSPTPEPDLPDKMRDEVIDMLINELPMLRSDAQVRERASQLKSAQVKIASEEAEKATEKMEVKIEDQMAEGGWTPEFAKFVQDITVYPTALMRGPIVINKAVGSWDGNEYKAINKSFPTVRKISAFDAFPAPNAENPNDGEYFCERLRLGAASLYSLTRVEGFNAGNVREVLKRWENGYNLDMWGDAERRRLEDQSPDDVTLTSEQRTQDYDTIILNGKVKGKYLAEHGIIVPDEQDSYECEVWVIDDIVIRAILNPNPEGTRPIYATSYRKVGGSFWGQSVIDLVYDTMRITNAAVRSMVRNMGYASGPIGEVVSSRVANTQDPTDIAPYRVVMVEPDETGTGAPAYKFHNVTSISGDLTLVIDRAFKLADDLSGVPAYVLGNPNVAGAGRTLGGLSMLMGNAAKGIKNVQLNIDRDVISGLVTGFYVYNMKTSKDDSIKADCKVVARGATGLLQRELAQTRTVEILQLLTPYIENWDNMPNGIKVLLREVFKTTGLPVDEIIPDPASKGEALDLAKALGGNIAAFSRGASNPQPLPPQSLPQPPSPTAIGMPTGA